MGIMGLLGTISIGGFRAMRRGMEQSSVMRNVDQFVHNAYQRAVLDRQPTAVYFWNETRRLESDTESLLVVGRAVAVRRSGRITAKEGSYLIDEFGDLRHAELKNAKGTALTSLEDGIKVYLYKMNGNESGGPDGNRSAISQATLYTGDKTAVNQMLTDPDWITHHSGNAAQIATYGWYTEDAGSWKVGDAYGFEFAELTLPNNYIFGDTFSTDMDDPIELLGNAIRCEPGTANGSVQVCSIRPGDDGTPKAQSFKNNMTQAADKDPSQRDY